MGKTSELTGPALDWAVAKAIKLSSIKRNDVENPEDYEWVECDNGFYHYEVDLQGGGFKLYDTTQFNPSESWELCGPLIEEFEIYLKRYGDGWFADAGGMATCNCAPTAQVAICRAVVGRVFGREFPETLK